MSERLSQFEELIGDIDAFRLMLDGAFKEWEGSYDVFLADTRTYLFHSKNERSFRPFCRKLRSKPEGERLCWECDRNAGIEAAQKGQPMVYPCHAGFMDVAIPIFVGEESIATVFCGQTRPQNEALHKQGREIVQYLETELGFGAGELVGLWEQAPQIPESELKTTINRVWRIIAYVSNLGQERQDLRKAHQKDQQRLRESNVLEEAAKDLSGLAVGWDEFWNKIRLVLEKVTESIGANCAMALVPRSEVDSREELEVAAATSSLPVAHFKGRVYALRGDRVFHRVVEKAEIAQISLGVSRDPMTVCGSIREFAPSLAGETDIVVVIRVELGDGRAGLLVFLMNTDRDTSESLPIDEEKGMLTHLASLIGSAYSNCSLYQARQREIILRRDWLRRVTHQLLAPLHGVQGYAEDAWRRLRRWQKTDLSNSVEWTKEKKDRWKDELERWENSFESAVWTSHYMARLAENLAWLAYIEGREKREELDFVLVEDVGGLLIRCARDFQGLARERGLRRVYVDSESVKCLDRKINISRDLFRQAVGNLLDNAVKYSNRGTDIIVTGKKIDKRAEIRIINQGIRLYPEETEDIFIEGYRGRGAHARNSTGTGIGLTVAQQIIILHKGTLTTQPSEHTSRGWQTTFIVSLPTYEKARILEVLK